jgi:Na+-driven multidrug efflux pump
MLVWPFAPAALVLRSWRKVLAVGIPVALSNAAFPLALAVVIGIVARFGPDAVAGFGVGARMEAFGFAVVFALTLGLGPFIGQNVGAGLLDRVRSGVAVCQWLVIGWGVFVFILFFLLAHPIARLFTADPAVAAVAARYLQIVPFTFALRGLHQIAWSSFNVLEHAERSFLLELLHTFVLLVPLAYGGSLVLKTTGVLLAMMTANGISGIVGRLWLGRTINALAPAAVPIENAHAKGGPSHVRP